jgi:hypothetical protein
MTRSDITFGTLLVLGELHRPDKSALLAEGAFFFLGSMTVVDAMSTEPYDVAFAELAASQLLHALGTLAVGDRRCE